MRVSTSPRGRLALFGGVLVGLVLAQGCVFNNVSAEERLRDAVVALNDEVRWNRMDLATQRVDPPFRTAFSLTHHQWHRQTQIADSDIIHVQIAESRDEAKAFVNIRWYDQRTMLVAETTLEQQWKKLGRGYVLAAEEVRSGDPRLLELPEGVTLDGESVESETVESNEEGAGDEPAESEETAAAPSTRAG